MSPFHVRSFLRGCLLGASLLLGLWLLGAVALHVLRLVVRGACGQRALGTIPRGPIASLLRGLSTGERDAVLGRHLVIIRAPRPVGHPTPLIADDLAFH